MDAGKLVDDEIVLGMIRERLGSRRRPRLHPGRFSAQPRPGQGAADACWRASARRSTPWCCLKSTTSRSSGASRDVAAARTAAGYSTHRNPNPARRRAAINAPTIRRWCSAPTTKRPPCSRRLEVYERETRPLAQYYAGQGLLHTIDADAPMDEVTSRLVAALASVPKPPAGLDCSATARRAAARPSTSRRQPLRTAPSRAPATSRSISRRVARISGAMPSSCPICCASCDSLRIAAVVAGSGRWRCGNGASRSGRLAALMSARICGSAVVENAFGQLGDRRQLRGLARRAHHDIAQRRIGQNPVARPIGADRALLAPGRQGCAQAAGAPGPARRIP